MKTKIKIIILIIILVLLIILPPLFRTLFPKEKGSFKTSNINKELICTITTSDHYKIKYKTTYKNGKVEKIVIEFINERNNSNLNQYRLTQTQIDYFLTLQNASYKYINSNLIVTLNKNVYQTNKKDATLKNMYASYESSKKYYEKLGYDCK